LPRPSGSGPCSPMRCPTTPCSSGSRSSASTWPSPT
jgi:hypothetical protein